jgi:uncharacterized protein (TIGR00251 family)
VAGFYQWQGKDLILSVLAQPKSSQEKLGEILDDRIKIYINAPAEAGKANQALRRLLSRLFKTPASSIEILSGMNSRQKRIKIPAPRRLPTEISPQT